MMWPSSTFLSFIDLYASRVQIDKAKTFTCGGSEDRNVIQPFICQSKYVSINQCLYLPIYLSMHYMQSIRKEAKFILCEKNENVNELLKLNII